MDRLNGKVALITGGTTGIGLASAIQFVREGARVVIAGRKEQAGQQAIRRIRGATGSDAARYVAADVGRPADCARIVAEAVRTFGRLHVLFANAAIGTVILGGTVETIEAERWDLAYRANLAGVAECCRAAIPHLRSAGGGAIVITSSSSALVGTSRRPTHAYAATKGALISLTRALAVTYGPEHIRVNCIVPGYVRTRLTDDVSGDPERFERALADIPLGYVGEPEDIAYAAVYLASDEARFVTGATLVIDGGFTSK